MRQAIELIQEQNYKEALKVLGKLIKTEPDNAFALSKAGYCYAQTGDFIQAKNKFELASQFNPEDPWIWQYYGYILFQLGKVIESIKALKKADKYNPGDIYINHQLAFLYHKNQDYEKALKYANKAIEFSKAKKNSDYINNLLSLKALIYENVDKNKAVQEYFSLMQICENDPIVHDRLANLIVDKFKFSTNLDRLGNINTLYNKATQLFRDGNIDQAILLYKNAIQNDRYCYPAHLGIAQALYEKKFGIREIDKFSAPDSISKLFTNYDQLNNLEKNIIHASVFPFKNFINTMVKKKLFFTVVPIDTKLTDYPENRYLEHENYVDTPYNTLRGIGGTNAFVGVERIRDFLWNIAPSDKFIPACIAHEFAHQVWCLLDSKITSKVEKLYEEAKKVNFFVSRYSSNNVQEYFAEYYAYYARLVTSNIPIPKKDPMLAILEELRKYKID